MLTKDEARQILEKVKQLSKADHFVASLSGNHKGNIRFARNAVSTSGIETNTSLNITSAFGKKTGTSSINEFDDASVERCVRRSEELAQFSPENPEYMAPLESREFEEPKTFVPYAEEVNPAIRAATALSCIESVRNRGLVAAGFLEDGYGFTSMMNSKGLFAYRKSSNTDFSLTVRTEDSTGSGWVTRDFNDFRKLNIGEATDIAMDKAELSKNAKAIEPGKYTVILEPAAAIGLLRNMFFNLGARSADEGRSFLSKKGGGTKLGEQIVDPRVNIYSDPMNEEVPSSTWSGSGLPIKPTTWIEKGVVKNLTYGRFWAKEKGVDPVPFPGAVIMEGGDSSVEEMIKNTKRGILVTRLWYIRTVDPQTLLYTGLTRDGTFFIEDGKIKHPVKNFRFNESPIIMLNNLEALGKPQRINGNLIPPMKIRDFTFTSLSDAI